MTYPTTKVVLLISAAMSSNAVVAMDTSDIPIEPVSADRIAVSENASVEKGELLESKKGGKIASIINQTIYDSIDKVAPNPIINNDSEVNVSASANVAPVEVYTNTTTPTAFNDHDAAMDAALTAQALQQNTTPVKMVSKTGTDILKSQDMSQFATPPAYSTPKMLSTVPNGTPTATVSPADYGIGVPTPQIAGRDPIKDELKKKYDSHQDITVKPGDGELVPVAVGLQNQISTPFKTVTIKTSSMEVPIEVKDGYIFITPMDQSPIGLFIGEAGMPETNISLTLMPLDVPSTMIDVKVPMKRALKVKYNNFVKDRQQKKDIAQHVKEMQEAPENEFDPRVNSQYVERATALLASVAKGDIPNGYSFSTDIPRDQMFPCDINRMGMYHQVMQRLEGSREIVDVVKVTNDINNFRQMREEYCLRDDVIAVGVFDKATLAPGQSTEVYILRDKAYMDRIKKQRVRPSLIDNKDA
ncbi:type-F conjugative transfer system secretin TraK (plasmid) [Photobacterium damselae]|uniref:TraK domain-containing protein n=1 Tax=Photobacterium damselae TaxID=38293 RepID=UPI00254365CE